MIYYILLFLAASCSSIMDSLNFGRFNDTIFSNPLNFNQKFWNFNISSQNKWKGGLKANGELFLFSSTILVGLTDAWHLFKTLMLTLIFTSISLVFIQDPTLYLFNPLLPLNLTWSPVYQGLLFYGSLTGVWFVGFELTSLIIQKKKQ